MKCMDRKKLISYAFCFRGEYDKIIKAINADLDVPEIIIDNAITIFDDVYPKELLNHKYPPFVLFYKGNLDLLKEKKVGIVGSRKPCEYALKATRLLSQNNNDSVIVSGLAKGIDACAHEYANKTIGVLGCGIDYIYPMCNYNLIKRIEKEGLILSEYPGLSKPLAYHFPFRNRIIACLSKKIYVMQSSSKSGTMTTINEALELGREVKVLPYDVFNESGMNNNNLIYEGATPITNIDLKCESK